MQTSLNCRSGQNPWQVSPFQGIGCLSSCTRHSFAYCIFLYGVTYGMALPSTHPALLLLLLSAYALSYIEDTQVKNHVVFACTLLQGHCVSVLAGNMWSEGRPQLLHCTCYLTVQRHSGLAIKCRQDASASWIGTRCHCLMKPFVATNISFLHGPACLWPAPAAYCYYYH